jgi:hypothetical protein
MENIYMYVIYVNPLVPKAIFFDGFSNNLQENFILVWNVLNFFVFQKKWKIKKFFSPVL